MANRPSSFCDWTTDNPSNLVAPTAAQIASGYLPGSPLAAQLLNFQLANIGQFIRYLDGTQAATALASALDPSMRLIGGGQWSYSLATTTLSWSGTAYLSVPGLTDADNTIAPGSVSLPANSVAYVVSNAPYVAPATVTSGSATLTNIASADQITVGWQVSGTGIPSGTTVSAIDVADEAVTISAPATASGAGISLSFAGSGALTVQSAPVQAFSASSNAVLIARATDTDAIVGVGSGQMLVRAQESKQLLGASYIATSKLTAGAALSFGTPVYVSQGNDGRTSGSVYPCDASAANGAQRAVFLGFVHNPATSGASASIVSSGTVTLSGLTPGATYYLDPTTPGGITATRPGSLLQFVVPVGVAINATTLLLTGAADRAPKTLDATLSHTTISMGAATTTGNSSVAFQSYVGTSGALAYYWPDRPGFLTHMNLTMLGGANAIPSLATLTLQYEALQGLTPASGTLANKSVGPNYRATAGYIADVRDQNLQVDSSHGYFFVATLNSSTTNSVQLQARITLAY